MNEKGLKILEQYDLTVYNSRRGRNSWICETDRGWKLVTEFSGAPKKLEFQNQVLAQLKEKGYPFVDLVLENKEGELFTQDREETRYIVKDWFEGKECDTKNEEDILNAVKNLAHLHKIFCYIPKKESLRYTQIPLEEDMRKHSRQLRKVYGFVRKRRKKNVFEDLFLNSFPDFFEQAEEAEQCAQKELGKTYLQSSIERGQLCHGEYNQHNVIMNRNMIATTNFYKCCYGVAISDFGQFLRKMMEKQNWDVKLGFRMIEAYDCVRTISKEEKIYLKISMMYPEKFFKLVNCYYNTNKAWVPDKNTEKLEALIRQQEKRKTFLKLLE